MVRTTPEYLGAVRRSLLALAVAPVWLASAALLSVWPLRAATGHLAVLALLGLILVGRSLSTFQKIPFTCSYLPGKANVHLTSGSYLIVLIAITDLGAQAELNALRDLTGYVVMLAALAIAAAWMERRRTERASAPEVALVFEETPPADIFALDLHRDGILS
jgi:hypothetical protein